MSDEDLHRKVVAFLAGEFARTDERQCIRVELVSAQPGMRGDQIRTWERRETPEVFEGQGQVEDLATEILRLAQEHANSFGAGAHRFEVRTLQHMGRRQKESFRIRSEGDGESDGTSGDDAPTERGLVGQLMRHNEVNTRTIASMYQITLSTMSRTITDQAEENRQLRRDRAENLAMLEKSLDERLEREIIAEREMAEIRRKDELLGKLYELTPVIKSRLLGGGASAPTGPSPLGILASELGASLTPEQKIRIAEVLGNGQKVLLMELLRAAEIDARKQPDAPQATAPAQESAGGGG